MEKKYNYRFSTQMMPDWVDDVPKNKPTLGVSALTANDIEDIDRLYDEPKNGYLKSHIFLKKK